MLALKRGPHSHGAHDDDEPNEVIEETDEKELEDDEEPEKEESDEDEIM